MKYTVTKNDKLFGSMVELTEEEFDAIISASLAAVSPVLIAPSKAEALMSGARKLRTLRDHQPGSSAQ